MTFKNRKALWACLFLIFVLVQEGYTQSNYLLGKITLVNGETIEGWIDKQKWSTTPDTIAWKDFESQKATFGADDLAGFEVEGIRFERININQVKLYSHEGVNDKNQPYYVFVQVMVDGGLRLLFRNGSLYEKKYFIQNDSITINLADYEKSFSYKTHSFTPREHTPKTGRYRYILKELMPGCDRVEDQIENLDGGESELKKLVVEYNECMQFDLDYVQQKVDDYKDFGLVLARTKTTFEIYNPVGYVFLDGMNFSNSTNYSFGFFLNVQTKKNVTWVNEFSWMNFKVEAEKYEGENLLLTQVSVSSLGIQSGVRVFLPVEGAFKVYFQASPTVNIFRVNTLYGTFSFNTGSGTTSTGRSLGGEADSFKTVALGVLARVGIQYSRFGLFAGIEKRQGITKKANTSQEQLLSLGLSATLRK